MLSKTLALLLLLHGSPMALAARPHMWLAHSHNDYERPRPLADALAAGFESVEADLWLSGREVVVSHVPFFHRGSLEDLYLRPLQQRVDRLGSVHGDGRPFLLWLDLKEARPELTDALHAILARYPMLTVFTDERVSRGPVVAILTGDEEAKARYTDTRRVRFACRDSNRLTDGDPAADRRWTWYALPWSALVAWDGRGVAPRAARDALERLAVHVHRLGRRVRLYDVPERAEAWAAAIGAGVDQVGTDRPAALRAFLEGARLEVARPERLADDLSK